MRKLNVLQDTFLKKDGTASIYIVVSIRGKKTKFNTGVSVPPNSFNTEDKRVKGKSQRAKDLNLIIDDTISKINDIFVRYRLQHKELTPDLLRQEYKNPSLYIDFYKFLKEAIHERKGEIANSTINQHLVLLHKLKEFKKTLAFSEINVDLLKKFQRYLKNSLGNDINTIYNNMNRFRTYMNIAKGKDLITKNPFDDYSLTKAATDRIYLTEKELNILQTRYEDNTLKESLHKVLRHFLFMCYTGVRISDFRQLKKEDVISDILVFVMQKSKRHKKTQVKIPLCRFAKQLIIDEDSKNCQLFNPISDQKMNERIKDVMKLCNIRKEATNHSGRHTFATIFLEKTNDLLALQKLLGHSKIEDTMKYAHITDKSIYNQMAKFDNMLFNKKEPVGSNIKI